MSTAAGHVPFEMPRQPDNSELEVLPINPVQAGRDVAEHLDLYIDGQREHFRAYFIIDPTLYHDSELGRLQMQTHEEFRAAIGLPPLDPMRIKAKHDRFRIIRGTREARLLCSYTFSSEDQANGVFYTGEKRRLKRFGSITRIGKMVAAIAASEV